ncbi:MAG TPA: amidohydrolase family protein [Blastocatellia bacterium]|nr:amidohydrolase family protein [Blastocatellia bacterium]
MKKWLVVLLLVAMPAMGLSQSTPDSQTPPIAITNVTVIDATGAAAQANMTVIVADRHIVTIGKAGKVRVPAGAQVVDGKNKFLIPGLWDMHVHAAANTSLYFPLFIANGVTGVRNMHTTVRNPLELTNRIRQEVAEGKLLGPRFVANGPIVDGPKPVHPGSVAVANADEARRAVVTLKQGGADFIKVYSLLSRDAYFAIADEAKKQGIPFAGHVPVSVSVAEASNAGQTSIEHLDGVLVACSSREAELMKMNNEAAEAFSKPETRAAARARLAESERLSVETYDEAKAAALFKLLASNHTWQCPTFVVLRAPDFAEGGQEIAGIKYIPAKTRDGWNQVAKHIPPEVIATSKKSFQRALKIVRAMRRAGVEFLAGTDVGNPFLVPGFSLHEELGWMVKAGLTPMEALQAATRNPARFLGLAGSLGTIEKGKLADLVLLDANPLEAISNTARINAVLLNGRLFDRAALNDLLSRVEAAAIKKD